MRLARRSFLALSLASIAMPAWGTDCPPEGDARIGAIADAVNGAYARGLNPLVPADVQQRTLDAIFDRVRRQAERHAANPGAEPRPVVQVDLDLTALMPIVRTEAALKAASERLGIAELQDPSTLPLLPGYTSEANRAWLAQTDLDERYSGFWGVGDGGAYWNESLIEADEATPGLVAFVEKVRSLGGEVVFVSGRFTAGVREQSIASLERAGLRDVQMLIGNSGFSDAGWKEHLQTQVLERWGKTVAVIDDRISNRNAMIGALASPEDVLSVGIAIPRFSADPVVSSNPNRISTFES